MSTRILLFFGFIFLIFTNISNAQQRVSQEDFNVAYRQYPNLPSGILEAISYSVSHFENLNVDEHDAHEHNGRPEVFGIFGLVENGKGYFKNTLIDVCKLNRISPETFKLNPQLQITAVAKYINHIISQNELGNNDAERMKKIIDAISEIPNNSVGNQYCRKLQQYEVFNNLQKGFSKNNISVQKNVIASNWFNGNDFALLSCNNVQVARNAVTNGTIHYESEPFTNELVVSTDYPPALWAATNNYSSRNGTAITHIAIHTTEGSYAGSISWLQNPSSNASAHYVIRSSDGQITQMVLETNKAWHIGSENPYTIGIEHEGYVAQTGWYTTAMYNASAALAVDICNDRGISKTACYSGASCIGSSSSCQLAQTFTIKGHQHFPNQTHTDPGINWNWATYYNLINPSNSCTAPNAPTVANITTNSTRISWNAPSGATSYSVQYKLSSASTWTTVTSTTNALFLQNLTAGSTYNVKVATVCGSNTSAYSTITNFSTIASTFTACNGSFTDSGGSGNYSNTENYTFTIAPTGAYSVTLTFNSFGVEANYDYMYIYNGTSTSAPLIGTYTGTNSPGTITANSGAVTIKFTSDNATVSWGYSADWSCSTTPPCGLPSNLTSTNITNNAATLNWNLVSGATSYNVEYKPNGSTSWNSLSSSTNSLNLTNLSASTVYNWQVTAICSANSSSAVSGTNFTTQAPPCTAPSALTANGISATAATLNWTAGSGAVNFTLQYKLSSATTWTTVTTSTNTYSLSGLSNCSTYNWQVMQNCSGGSTAYVSGANFTTLNPTCATTTGVSSSNISTTVATLSWTAVSGAINYTVEWKKSSVSTWSTANVTNTTYALSGLSAGTTYNYRIKTNCNCATTSSYTTTGSFTTQASCWDANESNNTSSTATSLALGSSKIGKICTSTSDVDWFKVTTTATGTVTFNLTQLPADYDLELYIGTTYITGSYNSSTTNEVITRTNQAPATLLFRVYSGNSTAYNSLLDYKVAVSFVASLENDNTGNKKDDIVMSKLNNNELLSNIIVYPNPAKESINFQLENIIKDDFLQIQIFSIDGKLQITQSQNLSEGMNVMNVNTEKLTKGLYFASLKTNNNESRIIKFEIK